MRWKIETYILIFQTLKHNYQKDKCSIQDEFYKRCTIHWHSPNYYQIIIILDFFLLMEMETKLTIFHYHTLKYYTI
jgi:hypothetical protein